jgi:L-alanine-DL-glutamate epimerase-like enolase superfamily enzyme
MPSVRKPLFYWYLPVPDREPAQAAEQALAGIERGFRTIYVKIGFDLVNDLAIARAIRDAVGKETALRLDANEAWKSHEALRALTASRSHSRVGLLPCQADLALASSSTATP